jgi:hypothetical protein
MIHKHVDIWAVLLLLLGFAVVSRTQNIALRVARARMNLYPACPIEVRVGPFHMNRFDQIPLRKLLPPPLRFI